ncbi:MAG: hypothetical protein KDB14_27200 [Planctomycetales bacterium]|nr:hypothetical protein [Planctomycetales bacterium]
MLRCRCFKGLIASPAWAVCFALVVSGVSGAAADDAVGGDGKLKIFVLAGQSNMAGRALTKELPESLRTPPENVLMVDNRGALLPMRYRNSFGPEVSFAHEMAKRFPRDRVVIAKFAVGGTSAIAWSPQWSEQRARITKNDRQGSLYEKLAKQVRPLLKREDAEVVGILWAQGGRDARFEEAWKAYEQNVKVVLSALQNDFRRPGSSPAPLLIAETVAAPADRFPGVEFIRTAQRKLAREMPGVSLVSSEGLKTGSDQVHFNAEGQVELGRRFAAAWDAAIAARQEK